MALKRKKKKSRGKMSVGEKIASWTWRTVSAIAMIGVGGLFVAGGFENAVILSALGPVVHDVVGWVIIGGTIFAYVSPLFKRM